MKAIATVVLALSGAVVAVAAPGDDMHTAGTMPAAMGLPSAPPQVQQSGDVSYLNGGVGEEEVQWMRSQAREYPLQLVISGKGGEYGVADSLTIRRGSEDVATVPNAGPWLLLDVPPGRYTLEANFDGKTERRSVQVTGKGVQRVNWNTLAASE